MEERNPRMNWEADASHRGELEKAIKKRKRIETTKRTKRDKESRCVSTFVYVCCTSRSNPLDLTSLRLSKISFHERFELFLKIFQIKFS